MLLLPFHVLTCGLRALGWAPVMVSPHAILRGLRFVGSWLTPVHARCAEQPEGATPLGSTSDNAEAQHLRFVQRELAELKAELTFIRQAAEGGQLALTAPPVGSAAGAPPPPPRPRAGLAPPPPPPPPPPSAAKSTPAAGESARNHLVARDS